MVTLKTYQSNALNALEFFFKRLRLTDRDTAWAEAALEAGGVPQRPYDPTAHGEVPSVCVRIPTGGGKTVLAAHAIPLIGKTYDDEAPVALWLVPTDAIRAQTLAALKTPRSQVRDALEQAYGDRLRVCALDELATVGRHEIGASAIVIVATIQSFNVKDKSIRNVYAFDETLESHFQGLTQQQMESLDKVTEADVVAQPYLTAADIGRVKASLGNFLTLTRPLVVVDEAHNNRTKQAFQTLRDLGPRCIIELTATPAKSSNVLFHVGAQALSQEEMIKLPIVLMEHPNGWRAALRDGILTRSRLEQVATREPEYVRPVLLIQAQPKGGEATVEEVLAHLTSDDGEKLDRAQIAVATGSQKELDGVNLFDPSCPIRYVITVEALKEGWDCPFAYVLASLQSSRNAKDVEQLLGRVLRMPYARARQVPELNKAYAHIVAQSFAEVASDLVDRLVQNMGFERYEAVAAFTPAAAAAQQALLSQTAESPRPSAYVSLPNVPKLEVPLGLSESLKIVPTMSGGATAMIVGPVTDEHEEFLLQSYSGAARERVKVSIEQERLRIATMTAPGARGVRFAPLPQLCIDFEGSLQPLDRRLLSLLGEFDLFEGGISLEAFSLQETGNVFEITVEGERVRYQAGESAQLQLNQIISKWEERDLVRWLDRECRQLDVVQSSLLLWLLKVVQHLQHDRKFPLTALIRARHQVKEAITREIHRRRQKAIHKGFQMKLEVFQAAPPLEESFTYAFEFHPTAYPAKPPYYSGKYKFSKHYYPVINDLRERTPSGLVPEEFECARAIDANPSVRHWIRNVEREPRAAFSLPTSTDLFYPDFVCELTDGRVLVVEYKGEHLLTNDDTKEKAAVGDRWEKSSAGRCLFLMATKKAAGPDLVQQLATKIAGPT